MPATPPAPLRIIQPKSALLPVLATIPRSGTWFIRYSISFYCHLKRGGRITDRVTGQSYGRPTGPPFDFEHFRGGPLFGIPSGFPAEHLFVGHTVCPGFSRLSGSPPWWSHTRFHAEGYDYLNEGMDYEFTPVEFGRGDYAPIVPEALEEAAWTEARQRMVLVYREPVAQAESYLQFGKNHVDPARRQLDGRWLEEIGFAEYLFEAALPSYAKLFVTYQKMAEHLPDQVRMVPYEYLMDKPGKALAEMLGFLAGDHDFDCIELRLAVHLARQEHLQAIEREIKRSLDGTRRDFGSHIQRPKGKTRAGWSVDVDLYAKVAGWLAARGIAPDYFVWPPTVRPRVAAPAVRDRRAS